MTTEHPLMKTPRSRSHFLSHLADCKLFFNPIPFFSHNSLALMWMNINMQFTYQTGACPHDCFQTFFFSFHSYLPRQQEYIFVFLILQFANNTTTLQQSSGETLLDAKLCLSRVKLCLADHTVQGLFSAVRPLQQHHTVFDFRVMNVT